MMRERPFQSKAELARERAFEAHYHQLGNSAVVAALRQQRAAKTREDQRRSGATAARKS
ncbi:MAG: hypothetical protein U1E56_00215 [Bauldia sp.]